MRRSVLALVLAICALAQARAKVRVAVDVRALDALQEALESAVLLELHKHPGVFVIDAPARIRDYQWDVSCIAIDRGISCNSLILEYVPGGTFHERQHVVVAGPARDVAGMARRLVALFELVRAPSSHAA